MVRIVSLLWALVTVVSASAQIVVVSTEDIAKGDSCDTERYLVMYDLAFQENPSDTTVEAVHEPMRLEVGTRCTYFCSERQHEADSLNAITLAQGGNSFRGYKNVSWDLCRDYPVRGKTALLERFGEDRFVCLEDYSAPAWQPVADSSAVIGGYACGLAVASYKGRVWYAWYTADIPIDAGPWKLAGLPGLILRAYDARREYVFDLASMAEAAPGTTIYYKGAKYEPVSRGELEAIRRRYYADPIGYITQKANVTAKTYDDKGNLLPNPTHQPFNPIELPAKGH